MRPACAIMEGERRPAMTETIRSALLLIEAAPDAELTAASLAQALGYSPLAPAAPLCPGNRHFHRRSCADAAAGAGPARHGHGRTRH